MEILFPFEKQRNVQSKMTQDVYEALAEGKHVIAHAPTGLGKTAASLSSALTYAINNGKKIIFLTPKHTQHQIAIETLKKIRDRFGINVNVVDFIGKRWMCQVPGVQALSSRDFAEFCRDMKKEERCNFYNKVRKSTNLTRDAEKQLKELKNESPLHVEELCKKCGVNEMCPYEISCELAKEANVLIADYYHIFHPHIRKAFLLKTATDLSDCVIIVDEAQNLPERIREVLSSSVSTFSINKAIIEARKHENTDVANELSAIAEVLKILSDKIEENKKESFISKEEFISFVEKETGKNYEELGSELLVVGEKIRVDEQKSFVGSIGRFLQEWLEEGEGYVRILKKFKFNEKEALQLSFRCLDPSVSSKELFSECHSAVLMSGTLTPTRMYRDLLGMGEERTNCFEYDNPFPPKNKLSLIVPDTTTRYTRRNEKEFEKIATWCGDIVNSIPGNVAVFFPSYYVRDMITKKFERLSRKSVFVERQGMTKRERFEFLQEFKDYSDIGAVFLGVTGGSFGEGIDLPGKYLKGVVVVGIPLDSPDLETQALIEYYEKMFGAGWNYGYLFPAMNRVIQACGRVVRSESDRGAVVLLDERFTWQNYFKCLPLDWKIIVTKEPVRRINEFFKSQ